MIVDKARLKTALSASAVVLGISAAVFGLFAANYSRAPAQTATEKTPPADAPFTASQKKAIESIIRDYLMQNPEILLDMTATLQRKQALAQQESLKAAIAENAKAIYRSEDGIVAGNPNGNVTVVEFFDYNCGFCKRAFADLLKLIESDGNVRVVLKEFPIFGERSVGAARVAIAARMQNKYFELHTALLKHRGQVNEAVALKIASELGLNKEKLKADMAKPETQTIIDETRELAQKLGVQGTPFYLVGDRPIPGAPDDLYERFVTHVADVRKNGCTAAC